MALMYFSNPVFNNGRNVTVRRGVKWDAVDGRDTYIIDANNPFCLDGSDKVLHVVDIETKVLSFMDITNGDLKDEHDPECRTHDGLYRKMREVYPGFNKHEIITVVSFDIV